MATRFILEDDKQAIQLEMSLSNGTLAINACNHSDVEPEWIFEHDDVNISLMSSLMDMKRNSVIMEDINGSTLRVTRSPSGFIFAVIPGPGVGNTAIGETTQPVYRWKFEDKIEINKFRNAVKRVLLKNDGLVGKTIAEESEDSEDVEVEVKDIKNKKESTED